MANQQLPYTVLEGVDDGRQNAVLSNWPGHHAGHEDGGRDGGAYDHLKVAELREALGARDLVTAGTKPELIARLVADDEE